MFALLKLGEAIWMFCLGFVGEAGTYDVTLPVLTACVTEHKGTGFDRFVPCLQDLGRGEEWATVVVLPSLWPALRDQTPQKG